MATPLISILDRLGALKVADIMRERIVAVPWCATMDLAAALLSDAGVGRAPVVDDVGHCIGVISATDFLDFEMERQKLHNSDGDDAGEQQELTWDSVRRYMTPVVHSIAPHLLLAAASQLMCAERVHWLVVLDAQNIPVGAVSSLDVVAALQACAGEAAQSKCSEMIDSREEFHEPVRQSTARCTG